MKKLIAISVVFALLTGAAFAQVTLGASAWAGATLVFGATESDEGPFTAPGLWEEDEDNYWQHFGASLTASYETPDGEAGVSFTFKPDDRGQGGVDGTEPNVVFDFGGAWWYPAPGLLRLNMGQAGFDRGDATPLHYIEGSGNWFGISIYPVDMFTVNISFIDEGRWGGYFTEEEYKAAGDGFGTGDLGDNFGNVFMLQAIANIDGIGEFGFTFDNWYMADGWWDLGDIPGGSGDNVRGIFFDYNGEWYGVGVTIGVAYLMGNKDYETDKLSAWGFGLGLSYTIMDITLGLSYDIGLATIDGDSTHDGKDGGPLMNLGFSVGYVVPVDPFTLTLDASVDLYNLSGEKLAIATYGAEKDDDMVMEWELNIGLSREIGGFTFNAGVDFGGVNIKDSGVWYKVPIKFSYAW